jgi:hypothetical protein
VLQNKNLRRILGAYRAVGSRILEKEAGIPPISSVLTAQIANAIKRRLTGRAANTIKNACASIRNHAPRIASGHRAPHRTKKTPGDHLIAWLYNTILKSTWKETILQQTTTSNTSITPWKTAIRKHTKRCWDKLWTAYLATIPPGQTRAPSQLITTSYSLKIHFQCSKAITSLITQIRTERIGLNAFLADRHVPDKLLICTCGWSRQTAKHILLFCPEFADHREHLFATAGSRDYLEIVATARGSKAAATWLQRRNLLPQFSFGL